MHFHLPKPLHGWRAFAGEVAIIVLGVLIALGAEQVVDDWQWHRKVEVVRKSLMGELANDRGRWQVNMIEAPCAIRYLDRLDRWAAAAEASPAPLDSAAEPNGSFFWMHSANWNLATGSQTLDHFPVDEQLAFAALYDGVVHRQVDIETAAGLSYRVQSLIPLATDAQGRANLREAVGELKMRIGSLTDNDSYMTRHFDALGVKADRRDFAADIGEMRCGR
jgi:hypothetical protein